MSTKSLAKCMIVLLQVSTLLAAAHASDTGQGITVQVIDEVGVPVKEWQAAQTFADNVFRSARVSLTWVRCLWNPTVGKANCPLPKSPEQISLLILSAQSAKNFQDKADVFGMALELPNGAFASRGYIFYGRIQARCADKHNIREDSLLGAIMAHEIGHLLLGPNSHTRTGIMKPGFDNNDVPGVRLSVLTFDGRQSEALRVAVASRIQVAHSQETNARLCTTEAASR